MKDTWALFKREWRYVILQAIVGAVVILTLATGLSAISGQGALADRVDKNAADIKELVTDNKTLLCEALSQADNERLVRAVEENCP